MKNFLKSALFLLVLATVSFAQGFEESIRDASVVLYGRPLDEAKANAMCSGSVINHTDDTYFILTAAHCIIDITDQESEINIPQQLFIGTNGLGRGLTTAKVIWQGKVHNGQDLAILATKRHDNLPVLALQEEPTTLYEDVVAVGAPYGEYKLLMRGSILAFDVDARYWHSVMLMNIPGAAPGVSGTAVICQTTKKICGVIVGQERGTGMSAVIFPALPKILALSAKPDGAETPTHKNKEQ